MTIGNLPKDVRRKPGRRGQILLAYLPSSRLEHISNKAARRRVQANLFHTCMSTILKPLRQAGIHVISMVSGNGIERRCHPVFTMYIGDYPEQLLVTCCKTGTCPKCDVPRADLGQDSQPDRPLRDPNKTRAVLKQPRNLRPRSPVLVKISESNPSASRSGRIFPLSTYTAPSHRMFCISCTRVSSNTFLRGSRVPMELKNWTHAAAVSLRTTRFDSSLRV